MTTCTNHLPPLVICLTTLHIYMWRTYKYTPLLGPNVSLIGAQKVALPQQLEKIGTICSLRRIADISSRISDLRDVCWEIKRVPRRAEVTVLCWNWPEVCPGPGAADATILLRLHALSTQSWLEVTLWNLSAVRIIFNRKGHDLRKVAFECIVKVDEKVKATCLFMNWLLKMHFQKSPWWLMIFFLFPYRIMDPWCGARIISSAPR